YYGHFFCHVFHQDYVVSKGHNTLELEHRMWALLDARGAEYPAEHNVGHLYKAKPALLSHYTSLDPRNCFNPGIGRSSKCLHWSGDEDHDIRPCARGAQFPSLEGAHRSSQGGRREDHANTS